MPRKALDPRIQTLIANSVKANTRSFFVLVGSQKQQQEQVVNLHYLLTNQRSASPTANVKEGRPNVLWCYKKELGFTTHRKKREDKIKKEVKRGTRDVNDMDPFELFVSVTDIRYTYYKDTTKILGQTFGMLVLQDFEAITPNLLARTIETVQGGGIVVLMLKGLKSLKQLYTMTMDVHSRYRTEGSTSDPVARFNERFILSLGSCHSCLVLDDELNVLPISAGKDIEALPEEGDAGSGAGDDGEKRKKVNKAVEKSRALGILRKKELEDLKVELAETKPTGEIIKEAKTVDQAKAILTFTDAIQSKTLSATVALTAARGRGKSAALGLSIALAVAHSYSNIFVTSPSPENLKTLFEFILKGFDRLGYQEHLDYDIVQSTNPEWKGAVVRVNVFKQHRQTIQYIQPQDAHVLGQAELVVIDEAAAIPLPLVKNLLGPYLVFMASTINGYEGTGRSLSLKLIQQLRELSRPGASASGAHATSGFPDQDTLASTSYLKKKPTALGGSASSISRTLKEIKLDEPIRYGVGDEVERWLNQLLCLDAAIVSKKSIQGTPHPSQCELFYVSRDTLFSYHPASEVFLQRMMALYVASHYKNSPNDLQLMSDAPNHHLFVLLPPVKEDENTLPEPLAVLQVALEGSISKESILNSLGRGSRAGGDLIPWTLSQQFQDEDFASLSGARVVRIAVHPDYAKMGYGSRALRILDSFYSGQLLNLDEAQKKNGAESFVDASRVPEDSDLHSERLSVRDPSKMPPLLRRLSELTPEKLDYLGVSYGLTPSLFRFWKRTGYIPLYLRQTQNDLTGEHTCIMIKALDKSDRLKEDGTWLSAFAQDFRRRFISLLSFQFRHFPSITSLSVLEAAGAGEIASHRKAPLTAAEIREHFTPFDMKRLTSYGNNLLDYHIILDLLPTIASLYFTNRLPIDTKLSPVQASILLTLGLQHREVEDVEAELNIQVAQILALFVKVIRKLAKRMQDIQKAEIGATIPRVGETVTKKVAVTETGASDGGVGTRETSNGEEWTPMTVGLDDELKEAGREVLDSLDLSQYAIGGTDESWKDAEAKIAGGAGNSVVSITNPTSTKRKQVHDGSADGKAKEKKKPKMKR